MSMNDVIRDRDQPNLSAEEVLLRSYTWTVSHRNELCDHRCQQAKLSTNLEREMLLIKLITNACRTRKGSF
jgi:hypothetical protein